MTDSASEDVSPEEDTRAAATGSEDRVLGQFLDFLRLVDRPGSLFLFLVLSLVGAVTEAGVLLMVVAGAASMLGGADTGLQVGPLESLDVDVALATGLVATPVFVVTRLLGGKIIASLSADLLDTTRRRLIGDLMRSPWAIQATVTSPRLQELVSIQALWMAGLLAVLSGFTTSLIAFLAMATAAALIDLLTAVALLVGGGVLALAFSPLTRLIRRHTVAHLDETHRYLDLVDDLRGVLPELRIYGVRDRAEILHAESSARASEAHRRMRIVSMVGPPLYQGVVLFLMIGGLLLLRLQSDADVAAAAGIALVMLRGLRYSKSVQSSWHTAMEFLPYVDEFVTVRREWDSDPVRRGKRNLGSVNTIRLESVAYTYPSGEVGLCAVDLEIEPGTVVGLAGPSGAGKTTLAQVLLGLRVPTDGTMYIDDVPSTEFDEDAWYSRFAYVTQHPILLDADVAENVRFLRDDITDSQVGRALALSAMTSDLRGWESGDRRQVGTGGSEVSGGQRQRIAIARALAGDPDVLVLDEPTSALDSEAESVVRTTLEQLRGKLTVILIAHRPSTLEVCDVVVTMERGRIVSVQNRTESRHTLP